MIGRSFLALAAVLAAGGAMAQPAAPASPTPPLSLQTQLGAIPLVSPRALQQASRLRRVKVTQVSDTGQAVGEPREIDCPETGCQLLMALPVGERSLPFMADFQFVGRGVYVALQARAVEVGAVVEFEKGRRGPVFMRGASDAEIAQTLRFTLAPSATLRRLDLADDGKTLSAGNLHTRKRTPDVVLKVEIAPARARTN